MSKSLADALGGGAWSVSAVVFDLNDMVDDEGRPISERRADAATRAGVEMEMRECPYGGIRKDRLMNVSALVQISKYYDAALAEMAAFRRQNAGEHATWADILAGVVDQLSGPARYLLQQRNPQALVPAQIAVGHKLAAGFFGVMRGMHERLALGAELPVTVDSFLKLVDDMGALVGASEACAGSPPMIRKATKALIEGDSEVRVELDPQRLDMARCLALQVELGIFWYLYDRLHLWSLMRGEFREHLTPSNMFLMRKIESATQGLGAHAPQRPLAVMLPAVLDAGLRFRLAQALNDVADEKLLEEDMQTAAGLLNEPGSAIHYAGPAAPMVRSIANYLNAYRVFAAELSRLELELRKLMGYPPDTPIRLGTAVFPLPQALPWYEFILGRRMGEQGRLNGGTTGVRVMTQNTAE